MKEPADPAPPSTTSVPAALLEYFEAPGKYQLTLRQPAVLFGSVREILQLASDRSGADAPQSSRLREAANFFIRAALLYPGGDHYAVLGLASGEAPTDLKERYRLLMRLTHPDFAGTGSTAWPADAAVRVNRAYEVLSSPVLRREYDDQLAALRTQRPAVPKAPVFAAPAARRPEPVERRIGKKAALLFGAAVGIPAILLLWPRAEPDHLVQRLAPPSGAQREARADPEPVIALATPPHTGAASSSLPAVHEPAPAAPTESTMPPVAEPEPARVLPPVPPATPAVAKAAPQPAPARPGPAALANAAPVAQPLPTQVRAAAPVLTAAVRPAAPVVVPRPVEAAPAVGHAAPPAAPVPQAPVPASTPAIASAPAPVPAAAPAPPPPVAVLATAAPSAQPAAKLTATLTVAPRPSPTLADAQPLLTQVLQMLETGSGDQLLRLLDGDARRQPGAQALSRQYEQLVRTGRPIRVSQVDFESEPRDGVLLVTGHVRLHAGEPTIGSFGQKLVLKAEFAQRGGKVQLTGLSGAPE